MKKSSLYLLGLVTLFIFPIPTFVVLWYVEGIDPMTILDLDTFTLPNIALGTGIGISYAFLALVLSRLPVFDELPDNVEKLVKGMNFSFLDCVLFSICAGVGEELLFRSGVQFYLGPIITSILFVAVHDYLNPRKLKKALYGLTVLPFILIIAYGFESMGLWFAIFAHVSYDFILMVFMSRPSAEESEVDSLEVPTYTEEEQ